MRKNYLRIFSDDPELLDEYDKVTKTLKEIINSKEEQKKKNYYINMKQDWDEAFIENFYIM